MKIECTWNNLSYAKILSKEWFSDLWFEVGISFMRTKYHKYKQVFAISFGIFSIHIRW
jgi:hypothetical protein